MAALDELRAKIDETDAKVVELLNARAALVLQVKAAKEKHNLDIYSPNREQEIIERVVALARGGSFPPQSLERIFREIVSATRSLIGELVVSYLGPEFSLSHGAALKQFGERVKFNPGASIRDIFQRVEQGSAHFGVVPVESTTSGLVTATYEEFLETSLRVVAEVGFSAQLDLVAREGSLSDVSKVFGDASSFLRAARWLQTNLPDAERVVCEGGALISRLAHGSAALAPQGLAEKLQLRVLVSGLADEASVNSRNFVIGQTPPSPTGKDKTSLICVVQDRAGALAEVLAPFQKRGLSLTKIESRPFRKRELRYMFLIDLLGHAADGPVQEAIAELRALSDSVHLLGSYPAVCR